MAVYARAPAPRGADCDRERSKFRPYVDKFAVLEFSRTHHLAQVFDDMRLRVMG